MYDTHGMHAGSCHKSFVSPLLPSGYSTGCHYMQRLQEDEESNSDKCTWTVHADCEHQAGIQA